MAAAPDQALGPRGLRPAFENAITANSMRLLGARIAHYASEPEALDGASWADKYRVMSDSSNYDRWSTSRTPYLYEIARAMASTDPAEKFIIISKAAQMGLSEAILNDALRRIHLEPCPMLHFMETEDKSDEWRVDRFESALRQPPFSNNKSIRLKGRVVSYPGGFISCRATGSANALRGTTARVVYGDEVAAYAESISGEGDWLSLASQRIVTFGDAGKIIMLSTPLERIEGEGTFYSAMLRGDWRRYLVPCRHCGEMLDWQLKDLVRIEGEPGEPPQFALKCSKCGKPTMDGDERDEAVRKGQWRATKEPSYGYVSFSINGLCAPSDWRPLRALYEKHEAALSGGATLSTFHNTELGEFYDEPATRKPLESDAAQRMIQPPYKRGLVPRNVALLTMGVDVQKDHLAWEVKGWCERFENYSIDRGIIKENIGNTKAVVKELRQMMAREFLRYDKKKMRIWACGIDQGYKPALVNAVTAHFPQPVIGMKVSKLPRGAVVATLGGRVAIAQRLILGEPGGRTAKGMRRKFKYYTIGVDIAKRELYMALKAPEDSKKPIFGRPHMPDDEAYGDDYIAELVSEQIITKRGEDGKLRQVFHLPFRKANEALDLHVICRFMAEVIGCADWTEARWDHVRKIESHGVPETDAPEAAKQPAGPSQAEQRAKYRARVQEMRARARRRRGR